MKDRLKVLLVDEEADLLKILAIVLRQHGFTVKTAAGASEALKIYSRESFDLLVIELNMSGMSGIRLINRIRAINPVQKIVAISVHPRGCRFWDSRQISIPLGDETMGALDIKCLDKPFKLNRLLELIDELFAPEVACEGGFTGDSSRWRKIRSLLE